MRLLKHFAQKAHEKRVSLQRGRMAVNVQKRHRSGILLRRFPLQLHEAHMPCDRLHSIVLHVCPMDFAA
jgi:hypothetical protein